MAYDPRGWPMQLDTSNHCRSSCFLYLWEAELRWLSNLTPAMLGPKLPPPRNQDRDSWGIHLSPPAWLLFHRGETM